MLSSASTTDQEKLKKDLFVAIFQEDLPTVISIGQIMEREQIALSFQEQLDVIFHLPNLTPAFATKVLYCGAFSNAMTVVGLTCLPGANINEQAISVPLMEAELHKAVVERRAADVEKIKACGKWCINPEAIASANELQRELEKPNKTYLPSQRRHLIIQNPAAVAVKEIPGNNLRRKTY